MLPKFRASDNELVFFQWHYGIVTWNLNYSMGSSLPGDRLSFYLLFLCSKSNNSAATVQSSTTTLSHPKPSWSLCQLCTHWRHDGLMR